MRAINHEKVDDMRENNSRVRNIYADGYTNGYRDKSVYYTPGRTYRKMLEVTPNFKLNVTIKNIDEDVLDFKSKRQLKSLLNELEKELYQ